MSKYDFNSMSNEQKEAMATAMLCRRILQIDPITSEELGCPAEFVAFPMLRHFVKGRNRWVDTEHHDYVFRMYYANGDGRACEIYEIQYWARKYLEEIWSVIEKDLPLYIPPPPVDRHFLTDEMKKGKK